MGWRLARVDSHWLDFCLFFGRRTWSSTPEAQEKNLDGFGKMVQERLGKDETRPVMEKTK